jgi:RNA polymerase sigma-B factor
MEGLHHPYPLKQPARTSPSRDEDHAMPELHDNVSRAERQRRTQELLFLAHDADEARRSELLDEVILLNRVVAEAVANRYRGRGVATEDLHQAAFEGLVKAVQKFDPTVRPDLLTYAVPTIRGEVQRWFRDRCWMVRPPRRLQELQWRVSRGIETLSQELGREPTAAELSEEVGCSEDELVETEQSYGCFRPSSLDRPIAAGAGLTLGDTFTIEDEERSGAEARATLGPAVRSLSERDRRIVFLRFFEDRSQVEIGAELGVTQMQISRLLDRILRDLRLQIA